MTVDLIFRGRAVALGGRLTPAAIHVRDGVITAITAWDEAPTGAEIVEAPDDAVILPGVVDTHVHLNDPGRTEWEGFATGTRAAAAGGVTTLVDMPLNSVPATTSVDGLRAKLAAAQGRLHVDVGFWGGVVPGNAAELAPLLAEGVLGFKCFLVDSGVEEFPAVGESELHAALPILAAHQTVLLAHAEMPERILPLTSPVREYASYLASRPPEAETESIALLIALTRRHGTRLHVVHVAAQEAIPLLRAARAEGLAVTAESCQHYLTFAAEEIPAGATQFKCAPPIRAAAHREALWDALREGVLQLIATDHSPCPPELKRLDEGDFARAWGGIASLQFALSAVWTEASRRGHTLVELADWLAAAPARLAGLHGRKGVIAVGADADLVFFRPDVPYDWNRPIEHRHKVTPYAGRPLRGVVARTIVRGRTVYHDGTFPPEPAGAFVRNGLWRLNHAAETDALAMLMKCCASQRWAERMVARRPFASPAELRAIADEYSADFTEEDLMEAIAAHPRIGARSTSAWSQQEQRGMAQADEDLRAEMLRLNDEYFEKFGFLYLICATGMTAEHLLDRLRSRLKNGRLQEVSNAAQEQRKIMLLRLDKLAGV